MGKWDFLHPYDAQAHSALAAGDIQQAFEVLLQGYQAVVVRYCTTLRNTARGISTPRDRKPSHRQKTCTRPMSMPSARSTSCTDWSTVCANRPQTTEPSS